MGMIHFSAEFSSRTKADFNELSGELIKVTPALAHTPGSVKVKMFTCLSKSSDFNSGPKLVQEE